MTALKAFQVDAFIQKPDLASGFVLIYGSDTGLIHERAMQLMRHYSGGNPDPMSEISLDMSTLASEPQRLAVEARTSSLFGGQQIIRVREAGNGLVPILEELLEDWPDAVIIAEAGNLTPRDKLRALTEKSALARALPCYADTERDLSDLIRKSFDEAGVTLEQGAAATLADLLGNDREVTRREIEKLLLFSNENKYLSVSDIIELCGDNTALAMDQIVDSTATGHTARLESAMTRALTAGIDPNRMMAAALNHFLQLRQWRTQMQSGASAGDVLKSSRPRPHFSRTKSIEQQLRLWNDQALSKACERLYEAVRDMRKSGHMPETLARRALLAICITAAQK